MPDKPTNDPATQSPVGDRLLVGVATGTEQHGWNPLLPPFRRRGCATEIMRQSLIIARVFGVDRVLLTCDDDNDASSAVIERCGGVLDPDWPKTRQKSPKRRYWIA